MKKWLNTFFINLLILSLLALSTSLTYASRGKPYDKIVFFGDSLSDNGNLYSTDFGYLPKSPPYYQGRFSNNIVWSEHVAKYLEKYHVTATNYAVGGLTSVMHNPVYGYLPYSLSGSLDDYLMRSLFRDKSSTLFVIWAGANDYLPGATDVDALTTKVVDNIKATVESLIYYGGTNFLIINLPDLSATPYSNTTGMNDVLGALSKSHNAKLENAVAEIQNSYKKVNINLFNSNQLLSDLMANPDAYNKKYQLHITNTTSSCWQGGYTRRNAEAANATTIQQQMENEISTQLKSQGKRNASGKPIDTNGFAAYVARTPDLNEAYQVTRGMTGTGEALTPCSNPDEYIFWDRVHPTAVMHKVLSLNIIDFINQHYQPARG